MTYITKYLDYIVSSQDFPDLYTVGQSKALTEQCDFKSSTRTSAQLSILKRVHEYI